MIRKFLPKFLQLCLAIILVYSLLPITQSNADETKIKELEQKLAQTQNTAKTLANEISKLDNQAELTVLKIAQTEADLAKLEEEIGVLGGRIDRIRGTLTTQSDKVLVRIANTYKNGQVSPLNLFLSTNDFGKFLARYKYLKTIQQNDRKILGQLQTTKSSYTNQKETLEDKKVEAEKLKASLDALQATLVKQKKEKENLLVITKNDERTYQRLLSEARAAANAIAFGKLTYLRNVNVGDKIGSIIVGESPCSTGTHLHFEAKRNGTFFNPGEILKKQPFSYDYSNFDVYGRIDPSGPLDWPVNAPILVTQAYGSHAYARIVYLYNGGVHTGFDLQGGDLNVKAVKNGKLYAGSYSTNDCKIAGPIQFSKIVHEDGLETYYLHIYPQ